MSRNKKNALERALALLADRLTYYYLFTDFSKVKINSGLIEINTYT